MKNRDAWQWGVTGTSLHPGQQQALTAGFKTLMVRTDSAALSSYSDQVIEYRESFFRRARDGGIDGLIKSLSDKNRQGGIETVNRVRY